MPEFISLVGKLYNIINANIMEVGQKNKKNQGLRFSIE